MKTHRAWWLYFWFLVLTSVAALVSWPLDWVTALNAASTAIALTGLWGYLRQRPIATKHVWRVVFGLLVAGCLYAAAYPFFLPAELQAIGFAGAVVALLVSPPVVIALWRYAFRSPHLWARRQPPNNSSKPTPLRGAA